MRQPSFIDDHFGGGKSQHGRTKANDDRKTLHQFEDHGATKHDNRNADQQADDDQVKRALGRTCDPQHIVNTHKSISHHNGFHGAPERAGNGAVVLIAALVGQKFVGNPQQTKAAGKHQTRNLEQPDDAHCHDRTHNNRPHRAPHDRFFL